MGTSSWEPESEQEPLQREERLEDDRWASLQADYRDRFRAKKAERASSLAGRFGQTRLALWLKRQQLGISVFLGLAVVVGVAWAGSYLARQPRRVDAPERPPNVLTVVKDLPPFDEILAEADPVIEAYFAANSWREQLPFVRDREIVEPLMSSWHLRRPFVRQARPKIEDPQVILSKGKLQLAAKARYPKELNARFLVALKTDEGWRIDWEITAGYQATPWEVFSAERSTTPSYFRVLFMPDSYFNYEFNDPATHACYRLAIVGVDRDLYGYAPKLSRLVALLQAAEKPKQWRPVIVGLRFLPNAKADDQVEITEFLQEKWLVHHDPVKGHFDRRNYAKAWSGSAPPE